MIVSGDPELAVLAAADKRAAGSLQRAQRYLALAERTSGSARKDRQPRLQFGLVLVRLGLARARNDLDAVGEQAQRLLALAESSRAIEAGIGDGSLRVTGLIDLGAAEMLTGDLEAAERHLEQGLQEAQEIGQPWLELQALAHSALLSQYRYQAIEERARQAIDLARAHGWEKSASDVANAYVALGTTALWRGQLAEAEEWQGHAEVVLRHFAQPTTAMTLYTARAWLEFARGRYEEAASALRTAESIGSGLAMRHIIATRAQALKLEILLALGETDPVERALDEMDEEVRATDGCGSSSPG